MAQELFLLTLRKQGLVQKADFRACSGIALTRAFVCLVSPESSRYGKVTC